MTGRIQQAEMMALSPFLEGRKTQIHDIGMMANMLRSLRSQEDITLKTLHLVVPISADAFP